MKTLAKVIIFLFITLSAFGQKQSIKAEQLFITNKVNGNSVKLGASESSVKNFGDLIKTDTLYTIYTRQGKKVKDIDDPDHFIRYRFRGIDIYLNDRFKMSSFYANSNEMVLERKGFFSISPGDHLSDITKLFPDEVNEAFIQKWGADNRQYTTVFIQLSAFIPSINNYMDADEKIGLLFNPETKILEIVFLWIRP
jgi:hypothetical protein